MNEKTYSVCHNAKGIPKGPLVLRFFNVWRSMSIVTSTDQGLNQSVTKWCSRSKGN